MNNLINDLAFDKVKTNKFFKNNSFECIAVSIEKGKTLENHTSPKPVCLVMLEGTVDFHIHGEIHQLSQHQVFEFDADIVHKVVAKEDAKFILIR